MSQNPGTTSAIASKLLQRKWRQDDVDKHYMRLYNTKPLVDTSNSNNIDNFPHLINKPKPRLLKEGKSSHPTIRILNRYFLERGAQIEKDNLKLFNKMRQIIKTKHSTWRNNHIRKSSSVLSSRLT
jgi:hypothetical protein